MYLIEIYKQEGLKWINTYAMYAVMFMTLK